MIFQGVARMEEHNGHAPFGQAGYSCASVIRLTEYIHIPSSAGRFHARTSCCAIIPAASIAANNFRLRIKPWTNVPPRSRGGDSTWTTWWRVASAAITARAIATPEESGMHSLRRPRGFSLHVNRQIMRYLGRLMRPGANIFSMSQTRVAIYAE